MVVNANFFFNVQSATTLGMVIIRPEWVSDVWICSCNENTLATNQEFDCHKLPAFFKKRFTSTGLDATTKKEIVLEIEKNGGTY
jgi:hypothetical protein